MTVEDPITRVENVFGYQVASYCKYARSHQNSLQEEQAM